MELGAWLQSRVGKYVREILKYKGEEIFGKKAHLFLMLLSECAGNAFFISSILILLGLSLERQKSL